MEDYLKVIHLDNSITEIKESDVISRDEIGIIFYDGVLTVIPRSSILKLFRFSK